MTNSFRTEKLRVSEIYASVQGEGPRTGMGTVFLRFGGCNLRCPGWPCDTIYAIDPKYRDEWRRGSGRSVLADVARIADERDIQNVCLTGGEPFLQHHETLEWLVRRLLYADIQVEAFTNGTIAYPSWSFELVNFIMDWKLPGSGNATIGSQYESTFWLNLERLKPTDAIKFVIKDRQDFELAVKHWIDSDDRTEAQFWAGVVWGALPEAELVDWIQQEALPWHLNVQTHKFLWQPDKRGV